MNTDELLKEYDFYDSGFDSISEVNGNIEIMMDYGIWKHKSYKVGTPEIIYVTLKIQNCKLINNGVTVSVEFLEDLGLLTEDNLISDIFSIDNETLEIKFYNEETQEIIAIQIHGSNFEIEFGDSYY